MTILVPVNLDHLDIFTLVLICLLFLRLIVEGLFHLITSFRLLFLFRLLVIIVNFLVKPLVCLLNSCNFSRVKLYLSIFLFSLFFVKLLFVFIICIIVHFNINVVAVISPNLLFFSFFIIVSCIFLYLVLLFLVVDLGIFLGGHIIHLSLSLFLLILLLLLFICNRSLVGRGDIIAIGVNFFLQRIFFLYRRLLLLFHVDRSVVAIT